jgi:hypothetical protein
MNKVFSLVWFLFCLQSAFAQEQITDFENVALRSIQSVQFVDTLNGKIVFFVNQPEKPQALSLWISDGTPANTKELKDAFGETVSYNYNYPKLDFRKYGYGYLRGKHIWRTDGLKLERVITNSDSLYRLQEFNDEPLLIFHKYGNIENQTFDFLSFTWLDSLNNVSIWEKDVLTYQIIDSTLHYIKFNKQTKYFELHKILKGNIHHKNNIIQLNNIYISSFDYYTKDQTDYYFLNTDQGRKLISKQKNDSTNVSFIAWGNDDYFPIAIKDTLDNVYFQQKTGNDIRLFALIENGWLSEKWSVSLQPVYADYNMNDYFLPLIRNISIIGEKLVFNTITGSEGISGYYFNVLDIKSNKNRRSRNLGVDFGNKFYTTNVSQIDSNIYELDNKAGSIATYSFLADSITKIVKYPYSNPYRNASADSIFTINQQKVLLSGNIYNISDGSKKELIPSRQVFSSYPENNFYAKVFGGKLLFWQYNPKLQKTQFWVSNGEKNGSELLITLDGYFYGHIDMYQKQIVAINDKLYFYSNDYDAHKSFFYETDGTKAGTHKIFETPYAEFVKSNTKQIIFRTNKQKIVVIENGKGYLIKDIPVKNNFDVYQTATQTYIHSDSYEIYSIVDGRSILLDSEVSNWLVVYKNQIFYSKTGQLKTINESGKITEIAKSIDEFGVYGNKLIYKQPIADDKPPKITILDIPTNKIDLTIDNFYGMGFIPIQDAIIITSQSKSLIIKGSQRKDYNDLTIEHEFIPFSKGFITKKLTNPYDNSLYIYDYSYFDLETNQLYPITKANGVFYEQGKNFEYLLFYDNLNDSTSTWRYWTSKNKQMIELSNNQNLLGIDAKQVVSINSRNRKYSYWSFDGNTLTKRYDFENNNYSNLVKSDATFYWLRNTNATGNELIGLGTESIITYPEIVNGSEGITLGNVFHFNNQLYVYAFTYTYGWQLWKMGEGNKGTPTPLSKEEESENLINVFPNPVQDLLNIESQQSYHYRVINNKGQEMMQGSVESQQSINFRNLAEGLYVIQFFDGVKTFSKKVIKY